MHTKPTLLVLAAGMATRYGSLKQIDSFGPTGETIIDYSIYDALQAGFGKIVFVIRQSIEEEFRTVIQHRLPANIQVDYVTQELDMLPAGFKVPEGRTKPWGTGHAVWVAASKINEPFAVINGDDFYGDHSYKLTADFLRNNTDRQEHALVGFKLKNTLSNHGAVSRGICKIDENGFLTSVTEHTHILRTEDGIIALDPESESKPLQEDEIVSMNLMAFKPSIFPYFEECFKLFLRHNSTNLKAEFYLPSVVNEFARTQSGHVKLLLTPEKWFGVTYPDDKPVAMQSIEQLIYTGKYAENLWAEMHLNQYQGETKEIPDNLKVVLSQFDIKGSVVRIEPYGSGHIHDTYYVGNKDQNHPDYLLQRINHHVFKNVPLLMENILQVTTHLREKLVKLSGSDPECEVLTLIPTHQKQSYYLDEKGNYWRLYLLLKDTRSYDVVQTPRQAYEGGKAFGRFLALLTDLDATLLHESIPDFHNVENRLRLFSEALKMDSAGRVKQIVPEIQFAQRRADKMSTICRLGREGKLPLRITHNDTKFNNVLLNSDDEAQCVIDLDTVMPGYVAYDFGDAIRTTVVKTPEDEKDLQKIEIDLDLFKEFTTGFLKQIGSSLTDEEVCSLSLGVTLLPYIMGIRFLTDYIDGDTYYKINFQEHNLQRARAQFRLVEILEEKHELLQSIILEIASSFNQTVVEK